MGYQPFWGHLGPALKETGVTFFLWDVEEGRFLLSDEEGVAEQENWQKDGVLQERIHKQDLPEMLRVMKDCAAGRKRRFKVQYRMRAVSLQKNWWQLSGTVAARDEEGKVLLIAGVRQDITHFKQVEEELLDKHRQLDSIAEISGQAYWEWDVMKDDWVFSNHFFSAYGYTRQQIEPTLKGWLALIHPDDKHRVMRTLQRYLGGVDKRFLVEFRLREKGGQYLWLTLSGQITEWKKDKPMRMVGSLINIDRIKSTENALAVALADNKKYNQRLQEIVRQTEENLRSTKGDMLRQDKLLKTVNQIALELLRAPDEAFEETMMRAMKELALCVEADRIYIMQNQTGEGEKAGVRLAYSWLASGDGHKHFERGTWFGYDDFEGWEPILKAGGSVNGHVYDMSGHKRLFFEGLGIQSVLTLPVHIDGHFWGIVYLANTSRAQLVEEAELETLMAGSLLIVLELQRRKKVL